MCPRAVPSVLSSLTRLSLLTARPSSLQNVKAMDIQCQICKSTFLKTTRAPQLTEHAVNKHSKTLPDCFPGYEAS